jgi:hypothetical protein
VSRKPAAWCRPTVWILLAVLASYLLFFRTTFLVPDSSGTYAWSRSLLFDADVDFANEFDRLGSIPGDDGIRFHAPSATGRPGNPFGMGAGLLWTPFVVVAQAAWLVWDSQGPPGYSDLHILAASTGTVIYGLAALLLSFFVARRYVSPGAALWAAVAGAFGTPFLAYLLHFPTYSHVPAAFAVSLVLASALSAREGGAIGQWALAGLAVGLAALVRVQNASLIAVPLALWLSRYRGSGDRRSSLRGAGALLAGASALFSLQLMAWWRIYGTPLELPQGDHFLDLLRPQLVGLLLSPWHGLLSWTPVALLVLPGLWLLYRKDRYLAVGVAVAVVLQTWLVASVSDWWAGYAVGARRFVDLTPVFILALACLFGRLRTVRRGGALVMATALTAVLWNVLLTLQVRTGLLSPFRRVEMMEILTGQVRALWRLPRYLWELVSRWPFDIHLVVHRDSPVSPDFGSSPGWLLVLVLAACWALGLTLIAGARQWARATSRSPQ